MNTRRDFLKKAGIAVAATAVMPSLYSFAPAKKIGLQLYSFRKELPTDVNNVIRKIAEAGYREVETFGYSVQNKFWGLDPRSFRKLLDTNGLSAPSGHYGMDPFIIDGNKDELKSYIDAAKTIGTDYIIVPWLGENLRKDADDWKKVADRLNEAALICKDNGLKLGYHNHNFEFDQHGDNTGYNILLKNTESVYFELDLYWVVRSGIDPLTLFKAHPGKFPFWHIKDMDKTNHNLNTEVGNGEINYKKIYAGAKLAGLKHLIVEQENFAIDPFVSIKQSADYIVKNLF